MSVEGQIVLPVSVSGKPDVIRLQHELETIENFMLQAKTRKAGQSLELPKTSPDLESLAKVNDLNLLQDQDRLHITSGLKTILSSAPNIHISFASSPSPRFMQQIVSWFRKEINQNTLIEIGLQPSIAAGCTLRTTNKYFDFSLRQSLLDRQNTLIEKMRSSSE